MSEAPKEKEKKVVPGAPAGGEIVARGGRYYRNARFIIVAMFLGWGLWCIRDGFYEYPKANEQQKQKYLEEVRSEILTQFNREPTEEENRNKLAGSKLPHAGFDIPLNRFLGILLPPASLVVLAWTLYNSRGEYRLANDTLHVPGHPPIRLEAIRKIDKTRWDRKGIARLEYELPGGNSGVATLDDFVYAQESTDAIMDRVDAYVAERLGDSAGAIAEPADETGD